MQLARKRPDRIVPEYSLTGDLLSYRRCSRQYRYQNGSSLPPSRPVQLWYGEFMHGVLENVYRLWAERGGLLPFPIPYRPFTLDDPIAAPGADLGEFDLRRLGWPVEESLLNQNKRARSRKARLAAYRRAEAAINILGPHLFPLIAEAEQRVIGTREIPNAGSQSRAEKYALTGVIDVLTEIELDRSDTANLIRQAVQQATPGVDGMFEVIVDYKGTRRPSTNSPEWRDGEWQVQTYAWLRHEQRLSRRVAAGILIYINELSPGEGDMNALRAEVNAGRTDVVPYYDSDRRTLENWRPGTRANFTPGFLFKRAVRVIPVDETSIAAATTAFDDTVGQIEGSIRLEEQAVSILSTWQGDCNDRKTCAACDFRYFCDGFLRTGNQIGEEDHLEDEI